MSRAKLYFHYSAMNAGKSTHLLQTAYNYEERGMKVEVLTPAIDTRFGEGKVTSRLGISRPATTVPKGMNVHTHVTSLPVSTSVILVDEAQFFEPKQVRELADVVDHLGIPVHCYGLRTDFQGKLFPGSEALLSLADEFIEYPTRCWCGSKATMNLRMDNGKAVLEGDQVQIGDETTYISLCRKHWNWKRGRYE